MRSFYEVVALVMWSIGWCSDLITVIATSMLLLEWKTEWRGGGFKLLQPSTRLRELTPPTSSACIRLPNANVLPQDMTAT
nr:hypothetical protein CFP56_03144 [Quercus suber]